MSLFERAIIDLVKEGGKLFLSSAKASFEADLKAQSEAFQHRLDVERKQIEAKTEEFKRRTRATSAATSRTKKTKLQVAYEYLGVKATDPEEMVKAVYRAKAKVVHTDNAVTGNAEAFKKLSSAYEIIQKARRKRNGGK